MQVPAQPRLLYSEPMRRHTSFHAGGPADFFTTVNSPQMLHSAQAYAREQNLPAIVIGSGTNLLVTDSGYRGMIIKNAITPASLASAFQRPGTDDSPFEMLSSCCDETTLISVASGVSLSSLSRSTAARGLAGLEWAADIPGTVGGAIAGNAGANGGSIGERLVAVEVLTDDGRLQRMPASELRFSYRSSLWHLKVGAGALPIVTGLFSLERGESAELQDRIKTYTQERLQRQPKGWSAGSVFRNPTGRSAGRLIEEAGLKGYSIGGAKVSEQHANFIINTGEAGASQILELIELCRNKVRDQFGIELETEIVIIGEL